MSNECASIRPRLRAFALGAVDRDTHLQIAIHVEICLHCRKELERERAALAVLDALGDEPAPAGLAERTLARVHREEDHRAAPWEWRRFVWEFVVLLCVVGAGAAIMLPSFTRAREAARRSSCQNNLKQFGLVFKMYAGEEQRHSFPPVFEVSGVATLDLPSVYPEYLTDPAILLCPHNPNNDTSKLQEALHRTPPDWDTLHRIAAQNYCYLGWAIHDAADITLFLNAPDKKPGEDLTIDGHTLFWLRDGVEQHFLKDVHDPAESARVQNSIPVAFDNPATHAHKPNGVNVLFLDGHVQFVKLPKDATFPQALEVIVKAGRRGK